MSERQTFPRPDAGILSCIIGNLFYTVNAPCETAAEGTLAIEGTDLYGAPAALVIGENYCEFRGNPEALEKALCSPCRKMSQECAYARQ